MLGLAESSSRFLPVPQTSAMTVAMLVLSRVRRWVMNANHDRRDQHRAIGVAALGNVLLLGVFGLGARYVYQLLPDYEILEDGRSEVDPAVQAAVVGFLVCTVALVVAWIRAPRPDGHARLMPPFRFILGGVGLGVLAWLLTIGAPNHEDVPWWWDGFVWIIGGAAIGWTLGVWGAGQSEGDTSAGGDAEAETVREPLGRVSMADVSGEVAAPRMLVEKPRVRFAWFAGWFVNGVLWLAFLAWNGPWDRLWNIALGAGIALLSWGYGASGLRWGIVADEHTVRLTNSFRRHVIPWSDLVDIELEAVPAEVSLGFYRLVFVARGRRCVADAPTGSAEPGSQLFDLGQTLIAMRNRYVHTR